MKIIIDIPDWVREESRSVRIMAGMEQVAYKMPWEDYWNVKISRCSSCGECCKKLDCDKLTEEPGDNNLYRCSEGIKRPYLCCISDPKTIEKCTVKYKKVY